MTSKVMQLLMTSKVMQPTAGLGQKGHRDRPSGLLMFRHDLLFREERRLKINPREGDVGVPSKSTIGPMAAPWRALLGTPPHGKSG